MTEAATLQFERAVGEYAVWLAVPEDDRSPAPAWWWSSALMMRDSTEPMPEHWALPMGLPSTSAIGAGARLMLAAFSDQTYQPWPEEFPRRYRRQDTEPTSGQTTAVAAAATS